MTDTRRVEIKRLTLETEPDVRLVAEASPEIIADACRGYADSLERAIWLGINDRKRTLGAPAFGLQDGHVPRSRNWTLSRIWNRLKADGWDVLEDAPTGPPHPTRHSWRVVVHHALRDVLIETTGWCQYSTFCMAYQQATDPRNAKRILTVAEAAKAE